MEIIMKLEGRKEAMRICKDIRKELLLIVLNFINDTATVAKLQSAAGQI